MIKRYAISSLFLFTLFSFSLRITTQEQESETDETRTEVETTSSPVIEETAVAPTQNVLPSQEQGQPIQELTEAQEPSEIKKNEEQTSTPSEVTQQENQEELPGDILDHAPFTPEEITASEDEIQEEQLPDAQIEGFDTSNLQDAQGNWLFKRMWWERGQEVYQKLKSIIDKIMELRIDFFKRRSTLDKELFDTFYLNLGMGIAEFDTLLDTLTEWLSTEQPKDAVLSGEKQHVLDTLKLEQHTIDSVKSNIDGLKQIDNAIENSLGIIIEVINSARRHERDAWEYFKEIGQVLSEKKARELFYKLDIALQNVKQLSQYLEKSFNSYFEKLETRARETVSELQTQLALLKEKEIDLKAKVEILNKKIDQEVKKEIEEEETPKKPVSWWRTITDFFKSFF